MAEINIRIFDTPDGGIDLDAVFNPEYNQDHKSTPAQNFAGEVLQFVSDKATEIRDYYEGLADANKEEAGDSTESTVD